jgi:hypothetical protein
MIIDSPTLAEVLAVELDPTDPDGALLNIENVTITVENG